MIIAGTPTDKMAPPLRPAREAAPKARQETGESVRKIAARGFGVDPSTVERISRADGSGFGLVVVARGDDGRATTTGEPQLGRQNPQASLALCAMRILSRGRAQEFSFRNATIA
jgi:hypothetical protein